MELSLLTRDQYESWDKFCLESADAWFWHTTKWLSFCMYYGKDIFETRNLSFFITDDSGIIAICPLLMEKKKEFNNVDHFEFSMIGWFGMAPAIRNDLSEERREKILKRVFNEIDLLAKECQVVRGCFRMTPLAPSQSQFNWLVKCGCLDTSLNTQIMDLTLPLDRLWGGIRKGHKYDINRGGKYYQVHIYDKDNPDKKAFDLYRILHHKAAGRVTRPIETFEMMYDWILSGEGMLCGVSKDERFAGFSYIYLYKNAAYYGSASDDPDFETAVPISHIIQWNVINWLKEKGYTTYEMGLQQFGPSFCDIPMPKDLTISFFKRGFGGKAVPLFRAIKYYNKEHMKKDLEDNLRKLILSYQV